MEFQVESRDLSSPKNLVLYFYFSWEAPHSRAEPGFLAKIYEGLKDDPIGCKIPIFCCNGTGHQEVKSALALLDVLLGRYNKTSLRGPLETWILECEALQAQSCKLCIQIRDEGFSEEICLPSFRFLTDAPYFRTEHPTPMVYKAVPSIRSLEIQDKLKGLSDEFLGIDINHTT